MDATELILAAIEKLGDKQDKLADEVTTWRQEMGERVATIESQIKPAIVGNGQPSRLAVAEGHIADLQRERWKRSGIAAGAGGLFTIAIEVFRKKLGI
jgi:hypothetical protein